MTKTGNVLMPTVAACPDRWSYSFDGKVMNIKEEFDDLPDHARKRTAECAEAMGMKPIIDGDAFLVTKEVEQGDAVKGLISEAVMQGAILGLIPRKLYGDILEELTRPRIMPMVMAKPFLTE